MREVSSSQRPLGWRSRSGWSARTVQMLKLGSERSCRIQWLGSYQVESLKPQLLIHGKDFGQSIINYFIPNISRPHRKLSRWPLGIKRRCTPYLPSLGSTPLPKCFSTFFFKPFIHLQYSYHLKFHAAKRHFKFLYSVFRNSRLAAMVIAAGLILPCGTDFSTAIIRCDKEHFRETIRKNEQHTAPLQP